MISNININQYSLFNFVNTVEKLIFENIVIKNVDKILKAYIRKNIQRYLFKNLSINYSLNKTHILSWVVTILDSEVRKMTKRGSCTHMELGLVIL